MRNRYIGGTLSLQFFVAIETAEITTETELAVIGGMTSKSIYAWGRLTGEPHEVVPVAGVADAALVLQCGTAPSLAVGARRSYGDVCLNAGGRLLETDRLDRFVSADWETGVVIAEAGLTIDQLLRVSVPKGWFIPVTPGTKFVTLGGAVANDVHGKNHHHTGTFGRFVRKIHIARSKDGIVETSIEQNPDLFAATIGGLGLTGIILRVEFSMIRMASSYLEVQTIPTANTEDFFRVNAESNDWPYTVAWVDCFATGGDMGRGLFMRGRPMADGVLTVHGRPRLTMPFTAPSFLLNPVSIRGFNALYRRSSRRDCPVRMHYDAFFYPLDSIAGWNRLYGPSGFYQFQCVLPLTTAADVMNRMLNLVADARQGSFLVVLKTFGDLRSPGILSFPRPGVTLALDFPNKGVSTRQLLGRLNTLAVDAGGRIYPAKDATMTGYQFRTAYPRWPDVERLRDLAITSDFWRRVTGDVS